MCASFMSRHLFLRMGFCFVNVQDDGAKGFFSVCTQVHTSKKEQRGFVIKLQIPSL